MRLPGFDYTRPFFYMVTLKRLPGLAAFSEISPEGEVVENAVTRAFKGVLAAFAAKWRCVESLGPVAIMPDHLHLMIKLGVDEKPKSLSVIVYRLRVELTAAYWGAVGAAAVENRAAAEVNRAAARFGKTSFALPRGCAANSPALPRGCAATASPLPPVFDAEWHDWIVKREGQLSAFNRYILENAKRAALRRANARYFQRVGKVSFLGREWFGYGNAALLELPALVPFKGHRATREGSEEWNALVAQAARIGPGGAGVSTFMSPLEKACGNAIARAGGAWIVLSPEGFSPRWHPPRQKEKFCAAGRMLFLSLYEERAKQPTNAELYARCHEMVDLVKEKLTA